MNNQRRKTRFTIFHYLIVVFSALLILATAYLVFPDKTSDPMQTAPSGTVQTPETRGSSASDASSTVTSATEAPSSESSDDKSSSETETTASTEEASSEEPGSETWRIVDSSYQFAQDYEWADLYCLLVNITRTTPLKEGYVPCFALIRMKKNTDPILFTGLYNPNTGKSELSVYITDSGYVYNLLNAEGQLFMSRSAQAVYFTDAGKKYIYTPHVFLEADVSAYPDDLEPVTLNDLTGMLISFEELPAYFIDLTR